MTIGTVAPRVEYIENGSTTAHAIPFQFRFASEIRCTRIFGGVETVLVQGSDFNVAGGGGSTGTVNKVNGGTNTAVFRIERVTSRAQGLDLVPGGDFPADANEQALDRLAQVDQEQDLRLDVQQQLLDRAVLVPDGEDGLTLPAIVQRASLYLKFGPDGAPIAGNPAADFAAPSITINFVDLAPGTPAYFNTSGTWPDIIWNVGLPRGAPGVSGALSNGTYGQIVVSNSGATLTILNGSVSLAQMTNLAAGSVIGNLGGSPATPAAVTLAALTAALSNPTTAAKGVVPILPASSGSLFWLRGDNQWAKQLVAIPIACSDETSALTTGTAKVTFRMPFAMTLTAVRASLKTAQTSGSIFTADVNEGGSSIFGANKLTIDNTEKTSVTAATAATLSDTALADDAEITVDIDQVGDGTAKGLKIWLIGTVG